MREVIYDDAFCVNIDCNEKERNMKEKKEPPKSRIDFCSTSNYTRMFFFSNQRSVKENLVSYKCSDADRWNFQNSKICEIDFLIKLMKLK